MNILLPDSWLREYLETKATPKQIKDCLSLCGPSVERVEKKENDYVYEIEITSNRIDMASVYGIAREATAILPRFGIAAGLKKLKVNDPPKLQNSLPMEVTDPQKNCYRIMGIVMEIESMKKSPDFMSDRLEKSGVRSLNTLVDITNYVMLEVGHPCHVFDYDLTKTHKFLLRRAKKNEPIITLDGKKYLLNEEDVVIDDGTGRVIDLPGIMGTENSVVTENTKRIFFFIESNNPVVIRKTSMRYAIRTMAATINEKHPDPELVRTALLRGIDLYQKHAGAKVASEIIDIYPNPPKPKQITTSVKFINERLGINLKKEEIVNILHSLGFNRQPTTDNQQLIITPPTFRQFDVTIPEDIVEEVARIYGYHNLPSRLMTGQIPVSYTQNDQLSFEEKIKTILKYWGYTEVYHYSFISKDLIEKTGLVVKDHLKVANPLTYDIEYMRISLFPSILATLAHNQHNSDNLELFELAKIYIPASSGLPQEKTMLLFINQKDFYRLKGEVTTLFSELGIAGIEIQANTSELFHPNISLEFKAEHTTLAWIGKINPHLFQNFNLQSEFFAAYLNLDEVAKFAKPAKYYRSIPSFPPVVEDLTFILPQGVKIGPVLESITKVNLVDKVIIKDRFKNQITLKITYQDPNQNLTNEKVKSIRERIISQVRKLFNLKLKE